MIDIEILNTIRGKLTFKTGLGHQPVQPQAEIVALPSAKAVQPATRLTQNYLNFKGLQEQCQKNLLFGPFTIYC